MKLDKKDGLILNLLQQDCRISLTKISKKVGLSIDSVKKRISKMIKNDIIKDWSESLTTYVYKFEEYDMTKLMDYKDDLNVQK